MVAAAADSLPRLAAQEAPAGVVHEVGREMELLRAEILTVIGALLGDGDDIPLAFRRPRLAVGGLAQRAPVR
jgi:hypothetical protein